MGDLTYDEVVEIVAKGLCPQYDSLPERATYLQQKATNGERYDKADVRGDARAILRALSDAGIALVPREATEGMRVIGLTTMSEVLAWMWQKREGHPEPICRFTPPLFGRDSDAIFAAMLAAGEIRERET